MAEQPATLTRRLHQQTRDACECALPATARAPAADSTGTESEPRSSGPPLDVAVASEAAAESTTLLSFAEKDEDTVMLTAQGGERIVVGKNTVQLSALVGTMLADDDDEDHEEDEGADEDEDESDSSRGQCGCLCTAPPCASTSASASMCMLFRRWLSRVAGARRTHRSAEDHAIPLPNVTAPVLAKVRKKVPLRC